MERKTIPDFTEIIDAPTAGIRDVADFTCKLKKDLSLGLAEHIAEHNALYFRGRANNGNRELFTYGSQTQCVELISCPGAFIRQHVKKRDRHRITEELVDKVMVLLLDSENGFATPLPPREVQYCAFSNGYYNICRGKFIKGFNYPGYQRYSLQTNYIKKKHSNSQREELKTVLGTEYNLGSLLRCTSTLMSGYPVKRNLMWCSNPDIADLLLHIVMTVLPQTGAVDTLNITDPMPIFQKAAKGDQHSLVVDIKDAKSLTTAAWKKLRILVEQSIPTLIVAPFFPFMSYDADPDGMFKNHLYLVPTIMNAVAISSRLQTNPDFIGVLASESMRFLHGFINRAEPDIDPDIEKLLTRSDPNDIPGMTAEFLRNATVETTSESDIIEQKSDFCVRLAQYVHDAGGDPKKVTHQGVGVYLKKLGVNTNEIKLPGHKNRIVCLTQRKWNS